MTAEERAAILKTLSEYNQSPKLQEAIQHLEDEGVSEVIIRFDDVRWGNDGDPKGSFGPDETGWISYTIPGENGQPTDPSGRDIVARTPVVITLNTKLVSGEYAISKALAHELRHPVVPGINQDDEWILEEDERVMFNDIWKTEGVLEEDELQYLQGHTAIGSRNGDVIRGSPANDTLSGLSGDDDLDGAEGDDLVMGGAGMDRLAGGLGSNAMHGGLDADTYVPTVGVTHEQIGDIGGVDRLDLSSVSIHEVSFTRIGDSLVMLVPGIAAEGIGVTDQWLDASKIEQFIFSDGSYAASYIEYLAASGGGVCYDDLGQPMFCSPYGMPVVFDLDGDGVELIDLAESHVRFDVNADNRAERVGWVSGDDGILVLDRNGNGRIEDFTEMSFRHDFRGAGSDLEGLMAYDSDHDGFLTAADARFGEFRVWRDVNGNGHSEKDELFTLEALGIVSIGLERRNISPLDRDANANQFLATSTFQTADGARHLLGDVALFADMKSGLPILPSSPEIAILHSEASFG